MPQHPTRSAKGSAYLLAALGLVAACLPAPAARAAFRFAAPVDNGHDVFLWPANIHLGFGYTFDSAHGTIGLSLGLDVGTVSYKGLVADVFSFRMVLRSSCPRGDRPAAEGGGGSCGLSADMFLGPRVAAAFYPDDRHEHQLSLGTGIGWGSTGAGLSNELDHANGFLVLMPTLRYAWGGVLGLEVQSILPAVSSFGARYPATLMMNVVGGGLAFAALAR